MKEYYNINGFYSPLRLFSIDQANEYRKKLELTESKIGPLHYFAKTYTMMKWVYDIATNIAMLNFVEDIMRFLDNVLTDFINKAPDSFANAKYAAARERSVGLGVMGLHSYFQQKGIPFGSVMSKVWNKKIFTLIIANK